MSIEVISQSVMLAGIVPMPKWYAIVSTALITVSQCLYGFLHVTFNATTVGEVHPSFSLPPRARYLGQELMCSGTELSISQCRYNPPTNPECYVGNRSAAVICRQGNTVWSRIGIHFL